MSTLILRPNAAGDLTENAGYHSPNYGEVDEEVADDSTTYVRTTSVWPTYKKDLYNLPNHTTEYGIINSITIYFRGMGDASYACYFKPFLKSDSTETEGTLQYPTTWETFSQTWTINPADSAAWEWADIDALQIGVSMCQSAAGGATEVRCTQVYVEVDYTPAYTKSLSTKIGELQKLSRGKISSKKKTSNLLQEKISGKRRLNYKRSSYLRQLD